MKTLKDLEYTGNTTIGGFKEQLKVIAMLILKTNKEINTADWVEFFNIEQEFADAILGENVK